jgi:hypothetical protein
MLETLAMPREESSPARFMRLASTSRCLIFLAAAVPTGSQSTPSSGVDTLLARCAEGKIDPAFLGACRDVIREEILGHPASSLLPPDFFEWLAETPRLRDDVHLASASIGPKVAFNLQLLRSFDEEKVESHPTLAVAFAAAWAKGADPEPQRFWTDAWLIRGRAVPGMTESFLYHIEKRREMRVAAHNAPWQILAHLADSIVPIEERLWALDRYGKRKTEELHHAFGDVPYTLEPRRGEAASTLESFLEFGGPCTHNVQFAGGVFDAFGIPSGWAGGPGHTYPYWFEVQGREITIHRTNEIGNRNGKIRDPLGPDHVWEDDLRLLTVALNHSVMGQRHAALAAWAHRRVPSAERAASAPILVAALRENPYSAAALSSLADATALRYLSLADAGVAWKAAAAGLAKRPLDLLPLLERAVPAPGAEAPTFAGDLALLNKLEREWEGAGHSEALSRIPLWRARCLASRGKQATATRLLREIAADAAGTDPQRFEEASAALAAAVPGAPDSEQRLEVLRALIATVDSRPRAGWTPLHRSRFHAIRRAVAEMTALGREEQAFTFWYEELAATRGDDPSVGPEPVLVGGGGGRAFLDTPPGAELVGLRVSTTDYNGRRVIGSVQGIFLVGGAELIGELAGQARSTSALVRAPDGWRIIGIVAAGSDRLDGLQLVYTPREGSEQRIRMSEWVGSHVEHEVLIGGRGVQITGIRGRAGADVDAFGLVGLTK